MDSGRGCRNRLRAALAALKTIAGVGVPRSAQVPIDIHSLRKLQSLGLLAQTLGLLFVIGAWALADPAYQYDTKVLGFLCALIGLGLVGVPFVNTSGLSFVLTLFTLSLLAEAFYRVASASPIGNIWCLVVGIVIALVQAPIFANVRHYLISLSVVTFLLGRGQWIWVSPHQDAAWNVLLLVGVAITGVLLNVSFSNLRQSGFRQKLKLEAMAYQDALTGLNNRRSVMKRLRTLQETGALQQSCFLMIDIDNFKQINDSFGHDHGDAVLRALATAMHDAAAPHLTARLGGEEFCSLVETGDRHGAVELAERLLKVARGLPRHPRGSAPVHQAPLGVSIGVACGRPGDGVGDLLRRSDEALYVAKRSGKGCYRLDTDVPPKLRTDPTQALPSGDSAAD